MRDAVELDMAVIGGGIAGLWLINRLRSLGFNAVLLEKNALGAGQTIASQGIIHSGVKYTFDGVNRPQTEALSSMPRIWMDCISGRGEVDLRGTEVLAAHQLMFTAGGLINRVAGAFATKALRSEVGSVERADWPAVFDAREFGGKIYQLEEPVLATRTVLAALPAKRGEGLEVSFAFSCWLGVDQYSISLAIHSGDGQAYDWLDGALFFKVTSSIRTEGVANLNATATARRRPALPEAADNIDHSINVTREGVAHG